MICSFTLLLRYQASQACWLNTNCFAQKLHLIWMVGPWKEFRFQKMILFYTIICITCFGHSQTIIKYNLSVAQATNRMCMVYNSVSCCMTLVLCVHQACVITPKIVFLMGISAVKFASNLLRHTSFDAKFVFPAKFRSSMLFVSQICHLYL